MPMDAAQKVWKQMPDAAISQANPVSTTLYPVLPETANVRLISVETHLTWADTQPSPLEVVVTIDGQPIIYSVANPVTATYYYAIPEPANTPAIQSLVLYNSFSNAALIRSLLLEGKSVKVEGRVTWATTQPTPLVCRVKYAVLG